MTTSKKLDLSNTNLDSTGEFSTPSSSSSSSSVGKGSPAGVTDSEYAPPADFKRRSDALTWSMALTNGTAIVANLIMIVAIMFWVPCGGGGSSSSSKQCSQHSWFSLALSPIILLYLHDLLIAVVHMTMDNPALLNKTSDGQDRWGPLAKMAFEFQEHHVEVWKILRWPAWYQGSDSMGPSAVMLMQAALMQYYMGWSMIAYCWWTPVIAVLGQHAHRHCHTPPAQRHPVVSILSQIGVINTPARHALHHQTLDCSYAILNGWSNPLVDYVRTRTWLPLHALSLNWIPVMFALFLVLPFVYYAVCVGTVNVLLYA